MALYTRVRVGPFTYVERLDRPRSARTDAQQRVDAMPPQYTIPRVVARIGLGIIVGGLVFAAFAAGALIYLGR